MAHDAPTPSGHRPTRFARAARWLSDATGSGAAAGVLALAFVVWLVVGSQTGYPRWWELVVTVGFPFVTLALLIVIQHTQTHGNHALHLKLDELIAANHETSDALVGVEEASAEDLDELRTRRESGAQDARKSNSMVADRRP